MKCLNINGINIYYSKNREFLISYALNSKKILIAINAEKILNKSDSFKNFINNHVGYPDGIGAVWALKKSGVKDVVKIPGCELWLDIINKYHKTKSFYFVGGTKKVIESTIAKVRIDFPGINILNYRDGYIKSESENADLFEDVTLRKPDIVFVAMGSPKQELLMEEVHKLHPAMYVGLGGSFDVYIGNVERASQWWINNNLEWAFRLIRQPLRFKRQVQLLKFFYLLKTNQL